MTIHATRGGRLPGGAADAAGASAVVPDPREAALRGTAVQLEGVFIQQLCQAMRATVPDEGLAGGGSGEQMFTGLLDEHLAQGAAHRVGGALADALVRQLRGQLAAAGPQP